MREHPPFEQWDAAYVLGALCVEDRHAYEDHLSTCATCRAAVAELAAIPGLLATVPKDAVPQLLEEPGPDGGPQPSPDRLPALQHLAHRVRRRRWWRTAAASAATASALLLAPLLQAAGGPALTAQLSPSPGTRLSAEARLTAEQWGARIALDCRYPAGSAPTAEYELYLTDRRGRTTLVSTWDEGPGSTAQVVATTATRVADIARIDVRKAASGDVVLEARIPPTE